MFYQVWHIWYLTLWLLPWKWCWAIITVGMWLVMLSAELDQHYNRSFTRLIWLSFFGEAQLETCEDMDSRQLDLCRHACIGNVQVIRFNVDWWWFLKVNNVFLKKKKCDFSLKFSYMLSFQLCLWKACPFTYYSSLRFINIAMVTILKNMTNIMTAVGELYLFRKHQNQKVWVAMFLMVSNHSHSQLCTSLWIVGLTVTLKIVDNLVEDA